MICSSPRCVVRFMRFMQSFRRSSWFVRGESEVSVRVVTVLILADERRVQQGLFAFQVLETYLYRGRPTPLASTPPPVLLAASSALRLQAPRVLNALRGSHIGLLACFSLQNTFPVLWRVTKVL